MPYTSVRPPRYAIVFLLFSCITLTAFSQPAIVRQDPLISGMVSEVSSKNIETIVRKLVSFETRHTLSDTVSKKTGIGAARNWIKAEMERYAKESGGRMKVEFDTFTQPADGRRVTVPTEM
ncbi:MAG TPA: hypothetical protein VLZ28_00885 [Daejeonella sp.]|nr:hypothetical protein [Daejeonella sp.]